MKVYTKKKSVKGKSKLELDINVVTEISFINIDVLTDTAARE